MKFNRNFAKLENGVLTYAPVPLVIDGENVWTNDETIYLEQGYYKVVRTEVPVNEGFYYTEYWEIEGDEIVQKWEEHVVEPEPEEPEPVPEPDVWDEMAIAIAEGVNEV